MKKSDLFNLNYYRQADFTGSRGNICYRLSLGETSSSGPEERDDKEAAQQEQRLILKWWKGPFSTGTTQEEMQEHTFPYTDGGLEEAAAFIDSFETEAPRGQMYEEEMKKRGS